MLWKTEHTCDPFVDVRTEILTVANGRSSGAGAVGFVGEASRFAYSDACGRCAGSGDVLAIGHGGGNSRGSDTLLYPDLYAWGHSRGSARGRADDDGNSWGLST